MLATRLLCEAPLIASSAAALDALRNAPKRCSSIAASPSGRARASARNLGRIAWRGESRLFRPFRRCAHGGDPKSILVESVAALIEKAVRDQTARTSDRRACAPPVGFAS